MKEVIKNIEDLLHNEPLSNHEEWFQSIASLLMSNYIIKTNIGNYRFKEIEFYYHSVHHRDEFTYGFIKEGNKYSPRILRHKQAQRNTLTWFFHYSGVDIVFGNIDNPGGILIRTLENVDTKEQISGPLVVLLELLNQGIKVVGTNSMLLELVKVDAPFDINLKAKARIGIGFGNFSEHNYNYYIA